MAYRFLLFFLFFWTTWYIFVPDLPIIEIPETAIEAQETSFKMDPDDTKVYLFSPETIANLSLSYFVEFSDGRPEIRPTEFNTATIFAFALLIVFVFISDRILIFISELIYYVISLYIPEVSLGNADRNSGDSIKTVEDSRSKDPNMRQKLFISTFDSGSKFFENSFKNLENQLETYSIIYKYSILILITSPSVWIYSISQSNPHTSHISFILTFVFSFFSLMYFGNKHQQSLQERQKLIEDGYYAFDYIQRRSTDGVIEKVNTG